MTDTNKMMIAFEVTSIDDFAAQVNNFLKGSGLAVVFAGAFAGPTPDLTERPFGVSQEDWLAMSPQERSLARQLAIAGQKGTVSTPKAVPEETSVKEEKPAKETPKKTPPKKPAKAPAEPQSPEPPMAASETKSADVSDDASIVGIDAGASLENQKIKDEVLDQLRDLYMAGRVKVVREVLAKHGGGAKSFPEVEPGLFPIIREALRKGLDA